MCKFGIPQSIVTDNGPQIDSRVYKNFYSELKIKNLYSTPQYLQSNGQTEVSNKTLLSVLKKRLHLAKGKWVEELPGVLCDGEITIRPHIRDGGYHPHGNRDAHHSNGNSRESKH